MLRPFAADDAALHVVRGQVDDRDGRLGDVVGGRALDAEREDVARPAVGLSSRLLLDLAHQLGHVVARIFLGLLQERLARLRRAHAGDALERLDRLPVRDLELVGKLLRVRLAVAQRLVTPVLLERARLELFLALHHALLGAGKLGPAVAELSLDLAPDPWTSSLASSLASLSSVSASRRASLTSLSASRSAPASLPEARLRRIRYPRPTPAASASTATRIVIIHLVPSPFPGHEKAGHSARPMPRSRVQTRYRSSCRDVQGSGRSRSEQTSQNSHGRPLGRRCQARSVVLSTCIALHERGFQCTGTRTSRACGF